MGLQAGDASGANMEVLHPHCAGLDVHKETVVACVRHMVDGAIKREVRTSDSTTASLLALADCVSGGNFAGMRLTVNGLN
jgi:hypothetical protein